MKDHDRRELDKKLDSINGFLSNLIWLLFIFVVFLGYSVLCLELMGR